MVLVEFHGVNNMEEHNTAQAEALQQLIKDLGIDTLSEDKQNELIIKMTEVLLKRIFLETMDKLGEEGREEYEKMSEGEVLPEQIEAFFKEKINNYDEMVQEIIEEFRGEMMNANK
ncbi:MAG: hypothetical protein US25_C0085G0002 [Candidatus Moranbacteria bacterium GW2011_GWE1_36_7]|nr:MAG: hypothetical protein UR99_C0002G0002 [Candidatus Moranbacteria bacterium GW2011_GWD2_36_12]KKQ07027.1 MAG: hypothetical protein US16_C0003G0002 [Candidatus Moranbacteria bacterium GW2011_GWE2_36_40]KKQ11422.1 MAG: hypothetical protein US25_C0085G0002 [Candidatus Moranbacteria bacterium GW2011_GWE1_36_7]